MLPTTIGRVTLSEGSGYTASQILSAAKDDTSGFGR